MRNVCEHSRGTCKPDIVQIEFQVMAQYLDALEDCPAPRVLTVHEPGAKAALERWRSGQLQGRVLAPLDALAWKRFEGGSSKGINATVVFTERDRQAMTMGIEQPPIVKIPLGTEIPEQALNPQGSVPFNLLFFGNYVHSPNVDAAMRLAQSILPLLKGKYPEIELYLVGDRPPTQLRELANKQIIVTGRVVQVHPYLDRATIIVAPLRQGGGMRVKVLETLAAGKALVATRLAVEGLDVADGEQVLLAETDQEFRDRLGYLLDQPEERMALATRARGLGDPSRRLGPLCGALRRSLWSRCGVRDDTKRRAPPYC